MNNVKNVKQNIYLPYMLISLPFIYMSFILPIYSKEIGMDSVQTAGLYSIFSLVVLLFRPLLGKVCDKVGRKILLISSILLYCCAFIFYSISTNSTMLYVSRIIQAFASPMLSISIYCFIIDYSNDKIGERMGLLETTSTRGGIIGIILAVIIFNSASSFMDGWKLFFYICCGVNIVAILYIIFKVKETKEHSSIFNREKTKFSKVLVKLLAADFVLCCFSSMLYPLFILYLQDKFSANINEIGLAYMLPLFVSSIVPRYIGRIGDKYGRVKSMIIALIIGSITFAIFPSINSVLVSALVYCLINVANTLYNTASNAIFSLETHIENRGTLVGTYSTISGLGAVIGPVIGGILYKSVSISAPFYLCAFGYLITMIIITILFKDYYQFEKRFS